MFLKISPLCFSLFIDEMTEVLEFSKYHKYADDLQIYHNWPREMLFECIREVCLRFLSGLLPIL
jgi:hypothetical protein